MSQRPSRNAVSFRLPGQRFRARFVQQKVSSAMYKKRIILGTLLAIFGMASIHVRAGDEVEGVTMKDGQLYALQNDALKPLTEPLELPFDVEVNTNGNFKVGKDGKERQIKEGQVVRRDGWLLNSDGSVQPVFDHVMMKNGRVFVVRDGEATALSKTMDFPNGMSIKPDGHGSNLPGGQLRLRDGQLFRLDGTPIPARDTVSMKNGKVVVQKDGTLIPLQPNQIMGMSDGTRVQGDGTIQKHDGTTFDLNEGETILLDGANYGRSDGLGER